MKLQPNLEAMQRTVGTVEDFSGIPYDIDWMYGTDENGEVIECEDFATVFMGDEQIAEFSNPNLDEHGWKSVEELMSYARLFILSGDMEELLEEGGA